MTFTVLFLLFIMNVVKNNTHKCHEQVAGHQLTCQSELVNLCDVSVFLVRHNFTTFHNCADKRMNQLIVVVFLFFLFVLFNQSCCGHKAEIGFFCKVAALRVEYSRVESPLLHM